MTLLQQLQHACINYIIFIVQFWNESVISMQNILCSFVSRCNRNRVITDRKMSRHLGQCRFYCMTYNVTVYHKGQDLPAGMLLKRGMGNEKSKMGVFLLNS